MKPHLRPTLLLILVALAALGSTGCNTFRGVGQDVEKAGEEVQDAADDAQD